MSPNFPTNIFNYDQLCWFACERPKSSPIENPLQAVLSNPENISILGSSATNLWWLKIAQITIIEVEYDPSLQKKTIFEVWWTTGIWDVESSFETIGKVKLHIQTASFHSLWCTNLERTWLRGFTAWSHLDYIIYEYFIIFPTMVTGEVVIVKTWDFTPYQKWKELQANDFITIVHTSHIFYLQSWPSMILNFGHILFLFATMHVQWFFHFYDFLKNRNTRYDKDLKLNTVAFLAPTNVWETWFVWLYNTVFVHNPILLMEVISQQLQNADLRQA